MLYKQKFTCFISFLLLVVLFHSCSYTESNKHEIFGELWGYKLFCCNEKWGICDQENTECIRATYDLILPSRNRKAFLTYDKEKKGVILLEDESLIVVPAVYDEIRESPWDENWNVQNNHLYGLVSSAGKEIVAPISEEPIRMLYNDKFILKKNGLFYLTDTKGIFYNQIGWEFAGLLSNDRAAVCQNEQWGYIDSNGKIQIGFMWEEAFGFSNGIAWVKDQNETYFAINPAGKILFQTSYYPVSEFTHQGTAIVQDSVTEKYGLINSSGNIVSNGFPWETEDAEFDSNGHWAVTLDGEHWGLVDETGKTVLPFLCAAAYRYMCQFYHDFAVINIDGKEMNATYQVYNITGKYMCSFQSEDSVIVDHFENGLMLIGINENERAFIDPSGEIIIGPQEGLISNFRDERAIIYSNGKYGYIDFQGRSVIPAIYEEASDFKNGIAKVSILSEKYYINREGAIVSRAL